ncbi:MAG: redoxin domain-containing protein [Pirellulales bacterium]
MHGLQQAAARGIITLATLCAAAIGLADTVLFNGKTVDVQKALDDPTDLWVSAADLTKINGFVVKPQGICCDDVCVPTSGDQASDLAVTRDGQTAVSMTELARRLEQSYAVDRETGTWSFGLIPVARAPFLKSAVAPDFELKDRSGKTVRLSDYRGKKVLLVTWASWCGCRMDVAKWEPIYQKLKDKNFEILSVAEDTGGEPAAGPIFDEAKVSYKTIVDPDHTVSTLFNFVNVPSAAWIDEEGHVVRINEGTYASTHKIGLMQIGTNDYAPALEDWVANGAASKFAWSADEVAKHIRPTTADEAKAEALFQLGVHFYKHEDLAKAKQYWEEAEKLYPDSWNIHRQDWAVTDPKAQNNNWLKKVRTLKKPYYSPLELEK